MNPLQQLKFISNEIKEIPLLNPPFVHSGNLIEDFNKRVDKFYSLMKDLSKNDDLTIMGGISNSLRSIETLKIGIIESIKHHLSGSLNESYKRFERALSYTRINDHISDTAIPLSDVLPFCSSFYRVRTSNTPLTKREDLFHIPFNQRHRVKTQRFSISGLPCLYLGSSILVCWHEMGKPDFDKLYISAFTTGHVEKDMKIIDLAFNLTSTLDFNLFERLEGSDEIFSKAKAKISNLIIWPLVLACHYRKKYEDSFNVEYIIPNLLMEWVSSSKAQGIAGIAYRTTKFINGKNKKIGVNLILPPKHDDITDEKLSFCPELARTFRVTNPVSWQVLKTLNTNNEKNQYELKARLIPNNGRVDNLDEFLIDNYDETEFLIFEKLISNIMKFDFVDNQRS